MGIKKAKVETSFSLAFWLAIPSYFFLGAVCFIAFLVLFDRYLFAREIWAAFTFGLVASVAILEGTSSSWLRTFVHELKHGIAVIVYGGSLKEFRVSSAKGHVEYEIAKDRIHHVPVIGLAPYCLPLFSLPVLFACLVFEADYRLMLTLVLGAALGGDIALSYGELDPRQTDLKAVAGGFFLSALYIAGVLFFWLSACLLWVCAGRMGFVYAGYLALRILRLAALHFGFQ